MLNFSLVVYSLKSIHPGPGRSLTKLISSTFFCRNLCQFISRWICKFDDNFDKFTIVDLTLPLWKYANPGYRFTGNGIRCFRSLDLSVIAKESKQIVTMGNSCAFLDPRHTPRRTDLGAQMVLSYESKSKRLI